MNDFERQQTYEIDEWCKRYMIDHPDATYTQAYNACKHELRAARYREEQRAQKAYTDRQIFIRNYQQATGATRAQAEAHVNRHMPHLRQYGIQEVSAYINNPGGNDPETTMKLFQTFFAIPSKRQIAIACAGEWIANEVERLITTRAPAGDFRSKFISEYTRDILSQNPDIAEAYETGRMSESAIRTIFSFRFDG